MTFGHQSIINGFGLVMLVSCIQLTSIALRSEPPNPVLSQREMRADLKALSQRLNHYSVELAAHPERAARLDSKIAQTLTELPLGGERDLFALQVKKIITTLGDTSAKVSDVRARHYLPISIRPIERRWLALNRQGHPLDDEHPFVTHIDGLPLQRWVSASKAYLPSYLKPIATEQARYLNMLSILRAEIGIIDRPTSRLTLSNEQGEQRQLNLTLTQQPPTALMKPKPVDRFNDSPKGIFTLNDLSRFQQDSPQGRMLKQSLFTPFTILDLRHGYGSGDELLKLLDKYFSPDVRPSRGVPWKTSLYAIARYKPAPNSRNDFLKPLGFIPQSSLSHQELIQLDLLTQTIEHRGHFSQWHGKSWHPASRPSSLLPSGRRGKLLLLIGPECREQCQWIAQAARIWPDTLLIGEPTRGDYGKQYHFSLPSSAIEITFSTTQFFDASGQLLSGVPTKPDILLPIDEAFYWQGLIALVRENLNEKQPVNDTNEKRIKQ